MATISIKDVLREYFRRIAVRDGQATLADAMGIQRQNLNAILNDRDNRVILPQHLDAYAKHRGIPGSVLMRELMALAWEMETAQAIPAPPSVARRGYVDAATARELVSEASPRTASESQAPPRAADEGTESPRR